MEWEHVFPFVDQFHLEGFQGPVSGSMCGYVWIEKRRRTYDRFHCPKSSPTILEALRILYHIDGYSPIEGKFLLQLKNQTPDHMLERQS